MATSSQRSPPLLAVQPQLTCPGDPAIVELVAPVIAPGMLASHCCVHEGELRVTPLYIEGMSRNQQFGYWVVIDIVGLHAAVLELVAAVGIGLVGLTPDHEYATKSATVWF